MLKNSEPSSWTDSRQSSNSGTIYETLFFCLRDAEVLMTLSSDSAGQSSENGQLRHWLRLNFGSFAGVVT